MLKVNKGVDFVKLFTIPLGFATILTLVIIVIAFIQACYFFIRGRWYLNKPEWKSFIEKNNFKITMLHFKWYLSQESLTGTVKDFPVRLDVNPLNLKEAECKYLIEPMEVTYQEFDDIQKQLHSHKAEFNEVFISKMFFLQKNDITYDLQMQLDEFATYLSICGFKPMHLEYLNLHFKFHVNK